jgi:hypothetical protein
VPLVPAAVTLLDVPGIVLRLRSSGGGLVRIVQLGVDFLVIDLVEITMAVVLE